MNICVIGTGYVGLVVGSCLADFGTNVVCVDSNAGKIDDLNNGKMPIYEHGLSDIVSRNTKLGRLSFTTDLKSAIDKSTAIFLAVGTPEGEDGRADMSQIRAAALDIAKLMTEYKVIVVKSTVPVGTAKILRQLISDNLDSKIEFDVVSNPEFLREGVAVNDFLHPDRIVLGTTSERALEIMREIYRPTYLLKKPFVTTTNETAELIKYAANSMLALKISFINEIANLCDHIGADVYDVAVAIGMDGRIGPKFLHPGPGYGGSCFPKDMSSLANISRDNDYDFKLINALIEVNTRQRELVIEKVKDALGSFEGKKIAILGLSFKPNTDDIREAPAIYVARTLLEHDVKLSAYDPAAMDAAKALLPEIVYCENLYVACDSADLVLLMTEWNEFRDINFEKIKESAPGAVIYDTRNLYEREQIELLGFKYICTGRPSIA